MALVCFLVTGRAIINAAQWRAEPVMDRVSMTLAYFSTIGSSGPINLSVASKINDELINDDTNVPFDKTFVWTCIFLSGK